MNKLFFLIIFLLFSLGVQADTAPCTTSIYNSTLKAPQDDGVIHIVQGRHAIRVEADVDVSIKLRVLDSKQNVVFELPLTQQSRYISIDTSSYESGIYTLVAESLTDIQKISFSIDNE